MQNWDVALEELNRLKEVIDSKVIMCHSSISLFICIICKKNNSNCMAVEFLVPIEPIAKQDLVNALELVCLFQP